VFGLEEKYKGKSMSDINKDQLKRLWANGRGVFGDEESFRDWLEESFGKRSTRALTKVQAMEAISMLETGAMPDKKYYPKKKEISRAQMERIALLEDLLGWSDDRLFGFIKKQVKKGNISDLTIGEGRKVIIGMQKILSGNKTVYKYINSLKNSDLRQKAVQDNIRAIYDPAESKLWEKASVV
jgi:hypothetical protein